MTELQRLARRLADDYQFECQGGPLRNCMEWRALCAAIDTLADPPPSGASPQAETSGYIDIVFDGPPSHESGRFIEVENAQGASIRVGKWVRRNLPQTCAVDVVEAVKALRAQWLHEWREQQRGRHLREVK